MSVTLAVLALPTTISTFSLFLAVCLLELADTFRREENFKMVSLEDILAFANANPFAVAVAVFVIILPILIGIFNNKPKKPFLDPNAFKPLPLSEKKFITHNTVQLRFRLPHPQQRLGLPIGQHISFRATADDGSDVYRSYTPISDDDQLGSVDFIIKIYPQGKMSQVINKMKIGDTMLMKGPKVCSMRACQPYHFYCRCF